MNFPKNLFSKLKSNKKDYLANPNAKLGFSGFSPQLFSELFVHSVICAPFVYLASGHFSYKSYNGHKVQKDEAFKANPCLCSNKLGEKLLWFMMFFMTFLVW